MVGIAVCLPNGDSQYLPFGHSGGNLDEAAVKEWAHRELRGVHIDFFNGPFDINNFYTWGIDLEAQGCTVSDLGLWAALLDDHRKKSKLHDIAMDYLGYGKIEGLDKTRMADYHAGDVEEYARRDVTLLKDLRQVFWPMLDEQGLQKVRQLEDDCIYATCEMERNGAPLDVEKLEGWVRQSEVEFVQCLWDLHKHSGMRVNPNSTNDLRALFKKCDVPLPRILDKNDPRFGKVSFSKGLITDVRHPAIRALRHARRLSGVRSKYLLPYLADVRRNGVLRYALHQLRVDDEGGTISGRYSSSAFSTGDGANIQQVAGKKFSHSVKEEIGWKYIIRELFIPGSGLYCSADADQIEYRFFAHYARPPKIMEAYAKDPKTNFHKIVQQLIEKYKPITYELTKDCNFAGLFGAGLDKFSFMLGMTDVEAEPIYRTYHKSVPEIRQLLRYAKKRAEEQGFIRTILGRRARFPDLTYVYTQAVNRAIQGGAADENKTKLVELRKEHKRTGLKLRFTVHDEACGDVPDQKAADVVSEVLNRQLLPTRVPLLWTVKAGPNWADCKKVA